MLRCAKPAWKSSVSIERVRKLSTKNPSIPQPLIQNKVNDDDNFRGKFTGFLVIQGFVLAFLGVAYKMEDNKQYASKIESYYENVWGLKPTMETFRNIVKFIQPPIKAIDQQQTKSIVDNVIVEKKVETHAENNTEVPSVHVETTIEQDAHVAAEQVVESHEQPLSAEEFTAVLDIINKAVEIEDAVEDVKVPETHAVVATPVDVVPVVVPVVAEVKQPEQHPVEVQTETPKVEKIVLPEVQAEARAKEVRASSGELALEDLTRSASKTRHDLQASLLQDLHELDEVELRKRIMQLAAEFFERTKWEGLRLHEALKHLEDELSAKYTAIIDEQRAQLQVNWNELLLYYCIIILCMCRWSWIAR